MSLMRAGDESFNRMNVSKPPKLSSFLENQYLELMRAELKKYVSNLLLIRKASIPLYNICFRDSPRIPHPSKLSVPRKGYKPPGKNTKGSNKVGEGS